MGQDQSLGGFDGYYPPSHSGLAKEQLVIWMYKMHIMLYSTS